MSIYPLNPSLPCAIPLCSVYRLTKFVTKETITSPVIGWFDNANLLGNAPCPRRNQSGVRTAFPHSHWRHARSHCLGLLLVEAGSSGGAVSFSSFSSFFFFFFFCSSTAALWRRVSLFHMHGTKRLDFTDELTCSNVDPSRSSASATTVLLRYLIAFFFFFYLPTPSLTAE